MFLSVENIKTLKSEKYISEQDFKNNFKISPEKGDVLMTRIGDVGTANVVESNEPIAFYVSLALLKTRSIDSYFLCSSIESPYLQSNIRKRTLITAIPQKINKDEIGKVDINVPDKREQVSIGTLFKTLNKAITLQQRKLAKLNKLKKALLQKIFADKNNPQPLLRLKGFGGDWKQRKLGDLLTLINGRAYSQDELLEAGKYKVLRVGNFYTNDTWFYSNLELDDKYYANNGDLLYTWSATFGPHIWQGGKVIYHYHIWKIILSEGLQKLFTVQLLNKDKSEILANKNGSTMVHVTKRGMEQKSVLIPSSDEQKFIGSLLTKVDKTITLQQRKIDKLQSLKKSLLQNIFVN